MRRHLPLFAVLLSLGSCASSHSAESRIIVAGQSFPTEAPVIAFSDEGGYDAHAEHCWFDPGTVAPKNPASGCEGPKRYGVRSGVNGENDPTLEQVQSNVDLFVIHFDVCLTSRQCFKVLHDARGLSVHFLLDLDGTIYQTLDLAARARHATIANDRSIGIEIAQMGAYGDPKKLDRWYKRDPDGRLFIDLGLRPEETGLKSKDFVARPARDELFSGTINGSKLYQYDFTEEQYHSLALLTRSLKEIFPKLELRVPLGNNGVLDRVMTEDEFRTFSGVLGHWHVQKNKNDPGPAFDWNRVLREAAGSP